MPRLDPLPLDQLDADVQTFCRDAEAQSGTSASTRTYAHNPAVLKALSAFRAELARVDRLDPVLKQMIRLELATPNVCGY